MKHLVDKISRYEDYCRKDRELIAKHPDKQKYKTRLRNHEAKLARMKSPAPNIASREATEYITREQYARLEAVCEAYDGQHFDLSLTSDDDCPEFTVEVSFSVADYDNQHDFDWLRARLREAGIDPETICMIEEAGDALVGNKSCCWYNLRMPLEK